MKVGRLMGATEEPGVLKAGRWQSRARPQALVFVPQRRQRAESVSVFAQKWLRWRRLTAVKLGELH